LVHDLDQPPLGVATSNFGPRDCGYLEPSQPLDADDNCDFLQPPPGPWNRCLEARAAKAARPASFPLLPSRVVHEVQVDVVVRNLVALMTVRQIFNGDVVD
jgi:hypothetical protein